MIKRRIGIKVKVKIRRKVGNERIEIKGRNEMIDIKGRNEVIEIKAEMKGRNER